MRKARFSLRHQLRPLRTHDSIGDGKGRPATHAVERYSVHDPTAQASGAVGCQMMRRPLRIVLIAATVLSLVLCAATVAAWVRSYQAWDFVWWSLATPRLQVAIGTYRGGL